MSRQNDVYCMGRPARSSLPNRLAEKYSSQQCNVVTDRPMVSVTDKSAEANLLREKKRLERGMLTELMCV